VVRLLFNLKSIKQFGFGTGYTLLATFDKNFIRFKLLTGLALRINVLAGESDFDSIFFLKTDGILALLTNEGSMELARDFENFKRLISLMR
jgi:hypothetical protein